MSAWTGTRVALLANRARLLAERASQSSVRAALTLALVACLAPVPVALAADPPLTVTTETGSVPCPGDCVTVTASSFFRLRLNTATGAGVDQFFDLAGPTPGNDLAGGTGGGTDALFADELALGVTYYLPSANTTTTPGARPRLDLLESTPTRVRVRGEAFYENAGARLGGLKGIGDYTVMPSGRMAIRWNRRNDLRDGAGTSIAFPHDAHQLGELLMPPDTWALYTETGSVPPGKSVNDAFLLARNGGLGVTDFLEVKHGAWTNSCFGASPARYTIGCSDGTVPNCGGSWAELFWGEDDGGVPGSNCTLPVGGLTSSFLMYFKPTTFADQNDPNVTARSGDYRNPAALSFSAGTPWVDADENTAAADYFNESESAYPLEMDTTNGLSFNFDTVAPRTRYSPFFKIRQWRSLGPPRQITFAGSTLVRHVDYKADLKPVSRAHWASKLLWHCSMESATACTAGNLDVGTGGGASAGPPPVFKTGRYGRAAEFTALNQYVTADTADFNAAEGAIEFWYQPYYNHNTDGVTRVLWSRRFFDGTTYYCYLFAKNNANTLQLTVGQGPTSACVGTSGVSANSASYSWRAYDWVHLKVSWSKTDTAAGANGTFRLFVNGRQVNFGSPSSVFSGLPIAGPLEPTYFGGCPAGGCVLGANGIANGLIDEPRIYTLGSSHTATSSLAAGGLASDASEYLASTTSNFTMPFTAVDPSRRGPYLYVGADSKFAGLNVWLAGAGSGSPLFWQYWSRTSGEWTSLAVSGPAANLGADGSVNWTAPPDWGVYSVDGGPDLYYVRVRLPNGAVASSPIERLIKTDILLLQYEGDVTAGGQTFAVQPPAPSASLTDLSVDKTSGSATAEQWETVRYTLTVMNNGPNPASGVQLVDALPPELEFVSFAYSGGGSCAYAPATRIFSCTFPSIANSGVETVTLDAMVLAASGNVTNTASVTAVEPDPDSTNDTDSWTLNVTGGPSNVVPFLTVTSTPVENVVQFLNPGTGDCNVSTVVRRKAGGYPADQNDGFPVSCTPVGFSNKKCTCSDNSGLTAGTTYYYGAFIDLGGSFGPGRFGTGRPPDPLTQPAVKWAFSTGTFGVAAPTVTQYGVIGTSNDGAVYSMQRGAVSGVGGLWATGAPAGDWQPYRLGGIAQSRSPFVPAIAVGTDSVYLGAQDGVVYALNAQTGAFRGVSPQLGNVVQAAPAGIFTAFTGAYSYLLVGTRDDGADNAFCALKPNLSWAGTGKTDSCYVGVAGAAPGRIGIVSSMAAVDYPSATVYFTGRRRDAQVFNNTTLWRLQLGASPSYLQLSNSQPLGEIDSSPILASDAGGNKRVYVGSGNGNLYSLLPDLTGFLTPLPTSDGQVKGFVFPDRSSAGALYFATNNYVSKVTDDGTTLSQIWARGLDGSVRPAIPAVKPSSPVLLASAYLYVGGADGKLYKINPGDGSVAGSVQLGDGKAVVGAPSYDGENLLIHVGTEAGIFYAVDPSLIP